MGITVDGEVIITVYYAIIGKNSLNTRRVQLSTNSSNPITQKQEALTLCEPGDYVWKIERESRLANNWCGG